MADDIQTKWLQIFDQAGIMAGTFNERMLLWQDYILAGGGGGGDGAFAMALIDQTTTPHTVLASKNIAGVAIGAGQGVSIITMDDAAPDVNHVLSITARIGEFGGLYSISGAEGDNARTSTTFHAASLKADGNYQPTPLLNVLVYLGES